MVNVRIAKVKYTENTIMTRKSHLNPAWFEAPNGKTLCEYLTEKTKEIKIEKSEEKINAILVPHAGYAYSLDTALVGYSQLNQEDYDRVLVLAPSHRFPLFEKVAIEPVEIIETPCGQVSFDKDFADALKRIPEINEEPQASELEHSIHVQLPLIAHFLPSKPVAGIMFGKWNYSKSLEDFAHSVYKILNSFDGGIARTLIIVSSDFTHYGDRFNYTPFNSEIKENLDSLDHAVFHTFASQDIALFEKVLHKTKATVCGAVAMKFLLALLPEKSKIKELAYTTSGEMMNDFSNSVSYLTASISADWKKGFSIRLPEDTKKSNFTSEERQMILDLARVSVDYAVKNHKVAQINYDTIPPKFMEKGAVFVTLQKNGQLRGCIGDILPQKPLVDSIITRAYSAALEDSRFQKVTVEELSQLDIEVSVLTPPIPVSGYDKIQIGTHGIILQKGKNSAVFLPQVPVEQGWTLEETLSHLSQKAGLKSDDWKEDCIFYVFAAEVLG